MDTATNAPVPAAPLAPGERIGAAASSIVHLLACVPIVLTSGMGMGHRLADSFTRLGARLPQVTEAALAIGDQAIGLIAMVIAATGIVTGWLGWRVSRASVPVLLLGAQVWWTAFVLAAYLIPSVDFLNAIAHADAR